MKLLKNRFGLLGLVLIGLACSGCLLVSGTFIVVADFDFTTYDEGYYYQIDVTEESDWQDHKDNIDFVDVVGFEMNITNSSSSPATFDVWIDDYGTGSTRQSTATKVLSAVTVPAGASKMTYAQSLTHVVGLDRLKALAKTGKFDYYGESSVGAQFTVDSGKVIITVSGSK
ncbi:MAG: hypothetical protein WAU88_01655 [Candidatus Zixiibacteriota bacterium]